LYLFSDETKELKESFFKAKEEIDNLKQERYEDMFYFSYLICITDILFPGVAHACQKGKLPVVAVVSHLTLK